MPGKDPSTANWPSDAEVDAALRLLTPELRAYLDHMPWLMLDHLGRAVPPTLEGQRREAFRHYFGPLDDHANSTAWHAPGNGALTAIAAVVWPFYDQLVAAKAAAFRRRQALIDMLTADLPAPAPANSAVVPLRAATDADLDACIRDSAAKASDGKTSRNQLRRDAPSWFAANGIRWTTHDDVERRLAEHPTLKRTTGTRLI